MTSLTKDVNINLARIVLKNPAHSLWRGKSRLEESDYKLIRQVGSGLAGVVWVADGPSGRVAMRRFGSTAVQGSEDWIADRTHFLQAGRQSLTLRNPRIVSVLDIVDDGADAWIASEFVADETLDTLLKREKLPAEQTSFILRSIALMLDYAHRSAVPHGDLKPSNIFIGEKRTVRVADFAISPRARRNPRGAMDPEWVHPYLSPEHFIAPASIGARSDQYSLAAIAYHMYTGKAPFAVAAGGDPGPAILRGQVAMPSAVNKSLSSAIDIPILKALSRDPGQRYSSCVEFIEHLEAALIAAAPPPVAVPGGSPKLMYAGLGSLVLALGVAAALMLFGTRDSKKAPKTPPAQAAVATSPLAAPVLQPSPQKTAPVASAKPKPYPPAQTDPVPARPVARQTQSPADYPVSRPPRDVVTNVVNAVDPTGSLRASAIAPRPQARPAADAFVVPPPADAPKGFSLKVFSRDETKHQIADGISFAFKDPELGEMGAGDLKAHVVLNGPPPPGKGPLTLEWKVDGTTMDGHIVGPNTISEFGNEPIPGSYQVVLRQGTNVVAEYKFRITR